MNQPPYPGLIASLDNDAPIVSLDTETFYGKDCSVKDLGTYAYCQHPEWDCYLVTCRRAKKVDGVWVKEPTVVAELKDFDWNLLKGHRVYSHNAGFDHTVYRRLVELGQVPDIEPFLEGWDCTADFAAYHCNRRSLAESVQFIFNRTLSKAVRDNAANKRWPKDFSEQEQKDMLAYGGVDADECLEIAIKAQAEWPDHERLLSRLNRLQGMRGIRLDLSKLKLFLEGCRNRAIEVLQEIPWALSTDPKTKKPIPPTSPKAYCQYCRDNGIPVPPIKAQEGEEAYLEWEAEHSSDHPVIAAVSNYRSITKVIKQLETLSGRVDGNGIFHFSLKYFGGHTGRFSGEGGFNLQNILKSDANDKDATWIIQDSSGTVLHAGPVNLQLWPEFSAYRAATKKMPIQFKGELTYTLLDLRSLFVPREGELFVIADSSQIEPRCLAFLTNDRAFIELVKQGYDIYEAHARAMHGFTGPKGHLKVLANDEKITKYVTLRARCKAERLGLGYQAGPKGYIKAAALLARLVLSEEEAIDAVRTYRAANPGVVSYWEKLQRGLTSALGRSMRMRLPSGRLMTYRGVQEERKLFTDDKGKTRWKTQLTAEVDGRRYGTYGGALAENACQATARDVFAEYLLMIWERSYQQELAKGKKGHEALHESLKEAPLFSVHDEEISAHPVATVEKAGKDIETIMRSTPAWMGDTPFDTEYGIEPCYKK